MSFNIQKLQTRSCDFTSYASSPPFSPILKLEDTIITIQKLGGRNTCFTTRTSKDSTSPPISGMFIHAVSVIHLALQH